MIHSFLTISCLQHFAEGGLDTGVTEADAGSQSGEQGAAPAAGVQSNRREEFTRLIRGQYKDLFDETVQDIIQKRLRTVKQSPPASPDPLPRAAALSDAWMEQAVQTRQRYPEFDLRQELGNPRFRALLQGNVDVRTAYEVLHQQELIPAAMAYAAKAVEQRLAGSIASGSARPPENGAASQGAATAKMDVSRMTPQQRQEIIRRVQRGETVRF